MKIGEIKKDNFFKVPEGYFDSLPARIQSKIQPETNTSIQWFSVKRRVYAGVAAVLLVLVATVVVLRNRQPSPEKLLSEVPTESLVSYLETSDITEEDLLADLKLPGISGDILDGSNLELNQLELNPDDINTILNNLDTSNATIKN